MPRLQAYPAQRGLHKLVHELGYEFTLDCHRETQSASQEYRAKYGDLRCRFIEWSNVNAPTADIYTEGGECIVAFTLSCRGWQVRTNRTADWIMGRL
jgi:hypothetical protein